MRAAPARREGMRTYLLTLSVFAFLLPAVALAQDAHDRVTFGGDVVVAPGEAVDDVVTMGGDATIDGDVVTMGGDVVVRGSVAGDVMTMGGDLTLGEGATVGGAVSTNGGDVAALDGSVQAHHGRALRRAVVEQAPVLVALGVLGDA